MLSVKKDGIKYHFLSLWYDSTWGWTPVDLYYNDPIFVRCHNKAKIAHRWEIFASATAVNNFKGRRKFQIKFLSIVLNNRFCSPQSL